MAQNTFMSKNWHKLHYYYHHFEGQNWKIWSEKIDNKTVWISTQTFTSQLAFIFHSLTDMKEKSELNYLISYLFISCFYRTIVSISLFFGLFHRAITVSSKNIHFSSQNAPQCLTDKVTTTFILYWQPPERTHWNFLPLRHLIAKKWYKYRTPSHKKVCFSSSKRTVSGTPASIVWATRIIF